jgi:hypothetical protein
MQNRIIELERSNINLQVQLSVLNTQLISQTETMKNRIVALQHIIANCHAGERSIAQKDIRDVESPCDICEAESMILVLSPTHTLSLTLFDSLS